MSPSTVRANHSSLPDQLVGGGETVSSAQTGWQAAEAGVRRLLLTHLWPGTDQQAALAAAAEGYRGEISVAATGVVIELP